MTLTFSHNNLLDVDANELFFLNESVANDFDKCVNVTTINSRVCQSCRLLSKCFNCIPNPINDACDLASAKKSFSKLKLLKFYLRPSMSQERLNDLTILCIKKNMLENIDVDTIINDFTSRNARRQCFL